MAFSAEQRAAFEAACAQVDAGVLRRLTIEAVNTPSPTGAEEALAEHFRASFACAGVDAELQYYRGGANVRAVRRGDGSGPALMLYAPIDMHIDGDARDMPWLDVGTRPDLRPAADTDGDYVIGLGADNPKGHAVCVALALQAIERAGVPLRGDLIAALGGGGMPVDANDSRPAGHGTGAKHLLASGERPDVAVIAKPGAAVAYEEVGLCWFELTVHGSYNYAGGPPRPNARNAIVDAATLVTGLQAWFPQYTLRNTSGLVAPNGTIGAVAGGWPNKPAFLPEVTKVYIDLRISPRTDPADAARQLEEALNEIRAVQPGLTCTCRLVRAVPGTTTPAGHWIVGSAVRAWEFAHGRPHAWRTGTSGATDANSLRAHGIPTARVGMAPLPLDAPYAGRFSMGVVSVSAMERLTKLLIAIAIDTCMRTRTEVGIG